MQGRPLTEGDISSMFAWDAIHLKADLAKFFVDARWIKSSLDPVLETLKGGSLFK